MTTIAGSGSESISQRHGSSDPDPGPDPHQNVIDPQHCCTQFTAKLCFSHVPYRRDLGVHTEWQLPLSGVYSIMMEKFAQAGEVHNIYHHVIGCSVRYAPAEWADKLTLLHLYCNVCTLWTGQESGPYLLETQTRRGVRSGFHLTTSGTGGVL
jgi:hypothetical protein